MQKTNCEISIVVPLYNEEGNVAVLIQRIESAVKSISSSFEIILVDDGSRDKTFITCQDLTKNNPQLKIISLSRNFGHQIALTAGIQHAVGGLIVSLDGDLQHPPELIPDLVKKAKEGFDIVNTIRVETKDAGLMKRVSSKGFYKIINRLSDTKIIEGAADFRLMTRKAADAFLLLEERDRFTRGLISWMGFNQAFVTFQADVRLSGKSKYTIRKMFRFALNGVTSFSSRPLRISFYIGLIISLLGMIYALYALIMYFKGETIQGWASLTIVVLLMGGVQLISIGIIGEYLSRVYNEVKRRPLYMIKSSVGFQEKEKE